MYHSKVKVRKKEVGKTLIITDFAQYNVNNASLGSIVLCRLFDEVLQGDICLALFPSKQTFNILLMRDEH
jgi:hypothetical protein